MKEWIIPALCALALVATCTQARAYRANAEPVFGTYSQKYLEKQHQKRLKAKRCCASFSTD